MDSDYLDIAFSSPTQSPLPGSVIEPMPQEGGTTPRLPPLMTTGPSEQIVAPMVPLDVYPVYVTFINVEGPTVLESLFILVNGSVNSVYLKAVVEGQQVTKVIKRLFGLDMQKHVFAHTPQPLYNTIVGVHTINHVS